MFRLLTDLQHISSVIYRCVKIFIDICKVVLNILSFTINISRPRDTFLGLSDFSIHKARCDQWLNVTNLYTLLFHIAFDLTAQVLDLCKLLLLLFLLGLVHGDHIKADLHLIIFREFEFLPRCFLSGS